jgi:hypothetical protein
MSWVKKSFRVQRNVQMAVVIRAGLVSGRIITRKELRNGPHAGNEPRWLSSETAMVK